MSKEIIKLPAFAKINLGLRILGRRPDGYHELETVFQTVSLCDRLTFEPRADGSIELACDDPSIPTDETNLVARSARALKERFGVEPGARVQIEKRIPASGGLGGGSSDAAVALLGFARLWGVKTDAEVLAKVAAGLGADVPFFLTGGTALGTGTGTRISPLEDAPEMHLVVVTPGVGVSTSEAYGRLNARALTKADTAVNLSVSRAEADFSDFLCGVTANDFEPVVFRMEPEILRARDALASEGARRASLSGSGSSVFGVFGSEGEAGRARAALASEPGWRAFACRTLTRAEYLAGLGECAAVLRPGRGA